MGLWGAAQALAFGLGGFAGTVAVDFARALLATPAAAYGAVFAGEALLFLASAVLAFQVSRPREAGRPQQLRTPPAGDGYAAAGLAAR
jgi:BCD family chlorophyll transporter-like MFS transporter